MADRHKSGEVAKIKIPGTEHVVDVYRTADMDDAAWTAILKQAVPETPEAAWRRRTEPLKKAPAYDVPGELDPEILARWEKERRYREDVARMPESAELKEALSYETPGVLERVLGRMKRLRKAPEQVAPDAPESAELKEALSYETPGVLERVLGRMRMLRKAPEQVVPDAPESAEGGGGFLSGVKRQVGRAVKQAATTPMEEYQAERAASGLPPATRGQGFSDLQEAIRKSPAISALTEVLGRETAGLGGLAQDITMAPLTGVAGMYNLTQNPRMQQVYQDVQGTLGPLVEQAPAALLGTAFPNIMGEAPIATRKAKTAAEFEAKVAAAQGGAGPPAPPYYLAAQDQPAAAPGGMSAQAAMSMTGPGPRAPRGPDPYIQQMQAAGAAEQEAIRQQAAIRGQQLESEAKLRQDAVDIQLREAEKQAAVANEFSSYKRQRIDAYQNAITDMADPVKNIDPGRWWASRSTGQKILAGVSIFFGGAGAGAKAALGMSTENDVLNMLEGFIKRDIDAQKADAETLMQQRVNVAAGQMNIYQMMRSQGMDEVEASKAAEMAGLESVKLKTEQLASATDSQMAKADAAKAIAAVDQRLAEKGMEMEGLLDERATNAAKRAAMSFGMKMKQAGGGEQLRGPQAMELGLAKGAAEALEQLKTAYKATTPLLSWFTNKLPFETDASEYTAKRDSALSWIGRMIDGSVLQKHDLERWERMMPSAGDTKGIQKIDALIADIKRTHDSRLAALGQAGFRAGGIPWLREGTVPGEMPYEPGE